MSLSESSDEEPDLLYLRPRTAAWMGKEGNRSTEREVREGKGGKESKREGFIQEIEIVAEKQILNLKRPSV